MTRFVGFGPNALSFFKALAFHQNRDWFEENRALYDSDVKGPMTALVEDLADAFEERKLPLKGDGKRSLFRLNRDVRFSKDKSPYKTHAGAVMTRSGDKRDPGLLYIHIAPEGCFTAAGFHMPAATELAAFRTSIRRRAPAFLAMTKALAKAGLELDGESRMSRLPRGYEDLKDSPVADAVRLKSLVVHRALSDDLMGSPKLPAAIADFAAEAIPLLRFGWEAVGTANRESE